MDCYCINQDLHFYYDYISRMERGELEAHFRLWHQPSLDSDHSSTSDHLCDLEKVNRSHT